MPLPVKPAVLAPLSATTYKIQFTADQDTHDKLRHAQALLRHQIPSGDMGAVINKALTLLIADVERKKFGIVRRPRGGMDAKDAVHAGSRTIPAAVRRAVAARVGFSTHRLLTHQMTVAPFALDREIPSVRAGLVGMLMAEGLFLKEAEAMVETWSTTWFEEGTRVFYIVPKPLVERTLPLDIRPGPGAIERVFVGRLEIAAPWLLEDLQVAFARFDRDRFAAHGRFLEPFSQRLLTNQSLAPAEKNRITSALAATTQAF